MQPLFDIGPSAFRPVPKVDSSFVRLLPHRERLYPIVDSGSFARLVAQAFSQRRKTLRNSLRSLLSETAIQSCGLDPDCRPERLAVADFVCLANALTRS